MFISLIIKGGPIIINITNRNEIFLKNKLKTINDLKTEIQSLLAFNKTSPVIVRADKSVVFDRVVQVLDVVKNAGVERLGIAIEEKPSSPHPNF
jgi:biopolymer transport protein ExbD